jgi:hypothetical protein
MPTQPLDNQAVEGDHLLPSDYYVAVINGSIESGKSTLAIDLITNKMKHRYNRVVVISPTILLDRKIRKITDCPDLCVSNQKLHDAIYEELSVLDDFQEKKKLPPYKGVEEEDCHTVYSPKIIQDIIETQSYIISTYGIHRADKVLLFIEDAPALGIFRVSHRDIFANFCVTLRHYSCSVIFCTQYFYAVPPIIRHQISYGCFFAANDYEQEQIYQTFSANFPKHKWREYFDILTHKRFNHITINLKNSPGHRIIRNVDEFVT